MQPTTAEQMWEGVLKYCENLPKTLTRKAFNLTK